MPGKSLTERIADLGHRLVVEAHAAWLAARDPRVPWPARLLAIIVAAYALSPIDLIPDFMPLLGYLDDAILLPIGILVVIRLIPAEIMAECRDRAAEAAARPVSRVAAAAIVAVWIGATAGLAWPAWPHLAG